jgi:hypothetical protein
MEPRCILHARTRAQSRLLMFLRIPEKLWVYLTLPGCCISAFSQGKKARCSAFIPSTNPISSLFSFRSGHLSRGCIRTFDYLFYKGSKYTNTSREVPTRGAYINAAHINFIWIGAILSIRDNLRNLGVPLPAIQ